MRVIAGRFGGRRLVAPRGLETRPTSDRVREGLFMALEPLTELRVVDLFAGSGALGIEALSRGARHADFADSDARALAALRENLEVLGLTGESRVWRLVLPRGLNRLEAVLRSADLVLLDPPYGGERAAAMLAALGTGGWLAKGARVVAEHFERDLLPERAGRLARERERRYGQTLVSTYRVEAAPDDGGSAPQGVEER
ncbi:MAG: 16S rRNA (guanine(966)-N(2))-methyltransferase RsmD [Candidatus Eisenbacteria bacterium]